MSTELPQRVAGWDCVRGVLVEIRASHDECEQFFADVFQELGDLSGQLVARESQFGRELAAARDEIRRQNEQLAAEVPGEPVAMSEELQQQLQQMAQQQSLLEQERAELETELEAVRNRAAEMAEALAEQKRLLAQQQCVWTDEFKRMRSLLESMSRRLVEMPSEISEADSLTTRKHTGRRVIEAIPPPAADPVLDSVLAQFEILQNDVARRRAGG